MPDFILNTTFTVPGLVTDPPPGFSDNFNRANAATLGSTSGESRPWQVGATTGTPTWSIVSDQAMLTASATGNAVAWVEAYLADGTLQVTVPTAGAAHGAGVVFRVTDGINYYYLARATSADFHYALWKRVAGTATQIGATSTVTITSGDVIQVVLAGSSIVVKVNGTTLFTVTDTTFLTATKHGLYATGSTALDVVFDSVSFA